MKLSRFVSFAFLLLFFLSSRAQETKTLNIIKADEISFDRNKYPDMKKFWGNVVFEIDSIYLYCDTAYLNESTKNIDAQGHIHINIGDTLNIYGDNMTYIGKTRIATIYNNVELIDRTTTLTTQKLIYDRNRFFAKYSTGGSIVDSTNTLTSIIGEYNTQNHDFIFNKEVVLTNPDYIIYSDTLQYNTESKISTLRGPTWIHNEKNILYAENGWYNTLENISVLDKNCSFENPTQFLKSDSLFYNKDLGLMKAHSNVWMHDTVQNVIVKGNKLRYHENLPFSHITDSSQAILIQDHDSLFLAADSLIIHMDSLRQMKNVIGYQNVRFYNEEIQGKCDSISLCAKDSIITLHYEPILWASKNQLSAKDILLKIVNNSIDSMFLLQTAFIGTHDTLEYFNQIVGNNMIISFKENKITQLVTKGNAEAIYYIKDESDAFMGLIKTSSTDMTVYFEDNKYSGITFSISPKGRTAPMKSLTNTDMFFPQFHWEEALRPKDKLDIFRSIR